MLLQLMLINLTSVLVPLAHIPVTPLLVNLDMIYFSLLTYITSACEHPAGQHNLQFTATTIYEKQRCRHLWAACELFLKRAPGCLYCVPQFVQPSTPGARVKHWPFALVEEPWITSRAAVKRSSEKADATTMGCCRQWHSTQHWATAASVLTCLGKLESMWAAPSPPPEVATWLLTT